MEIKNKMQPADKLGFKGYQHKINNEGSAAYDFNFVYDPKHWDCFVEFHKVSRNDYDYSYKVSDINKPFFTKQLSPNGVSVNIERELRIKDSEPIAYRYKLVNRHDSNWVKYAKDDSKDVCGDGCNLLTRKATTPNVHGPMILGIPDTFNPGYVFAGFHSDKTGEIIKDPKAKDLSGFTRTFGNKAGGNLAGMTKMIPELKAKGYKRFISTPTSGGDNVSSHKYWIKRQNQTDNIEEYDKFQTELFKNGMGYVADSAYTSQGLEGVNFQYAIRWMNQEDKPHEYYMFRMQGLQDAALGMGVVPKNMENLRHKIVNSPNNYEQKPDGQIKITKNENYDASQPTFIQAYDNSMVTEEQRKDLKNLIRDYDKTNTTTIDPVSGKVVTNNLANITHDSTLVSNAFMIDPAEYDANIKNLNIINANRSLSDKIDLNSPMGTLIVSKFSGIEIRPKDEGGFVTWDSNTDMAKLSYTESDYDTQMLESINNPRERAIEEEKLARAHAGNRDALVDTMRFWTKHVRNVQTEYTAKTLGKLTDNSEDALDRVNSLIYNRDNQQLPDDVAINGEIAENLVFNDYKLRHKEMNYEKALNRSLMEIPLDSIELADDTVGALSSPYLSKRSPDLLHIGESRYDAMQDSTFVVPKKYAKTYNKMNDVFTHQIHDFAVKVLQEVDKKSDEKLFQSDGSKLTEYGQYVVPMVAGDIAKYAIIKSLVPNAETKQLQNGKLTYDYENLTKNATLKSMGISGDSPEDEANQIINRMKRGINNFNTNDILVVANSINTRIKDTNAMSFRFAEAMVDRAGLGLSHRIDAAKDVADMDAVRSLQDFSDNQLSEVINIWAPAVKAVREENPSALMLAEFTDLYDTMKASYGSHEDVKAQNKPDSSARFKNADGISEILLRETGMNSEANYSHFFTAGLNTFGKDFVKGFDGDNKNGTEAERLGLLAGALDKFANMPEDYKQNAYTFGGNHDKPRMAECFGMDMKLFHANLSNKSSDEEKNHRKTAYMILNDKLFEHDLNEGDWNTINNSTDYFNNVSAKAIAKADWIRSSIGVVNNIVKNERLSKAHDDNSRKEIQKDSDKIFAALSQSIRDIADGNYYLNGENTNKNKSIADSYKKQLEKDGFGAMDVMTAFDMVTKHAEAKYDLKNTYLNDADFKKDFNNLFEKVAVGVPMAKVRMYTQMINAIPGNPTVYAGDEFGMTGYDEKNHNLYLFNRNPINRNVVDENSPAYREHIAKHKEAMEGIVATRKDDISNKMNALNNGTMYKLEDLYGANADKESENGLRCPAIISQATDGSMNVSVFNYNGISLEDPFLGKNINKREDLNDVLNPKSKPVKLEKIMLKSSKTGEKIELPDGTKFKNIESSDPSYYESCHDDNGDICLVRKFENKEKSEAVYITKETAPEGVLRLYHQPIEVEQSIKAKEALEKKYTPSFKGARQYYNPTYNIAVSNPYSSPKQVKAGESLSIISK